MASSEELTLYTTKAFGRLDFCYFEDELHTCPFYIKKTFGILMKESNIVFKFGFILTEEEECSFQVKIIYLSEDPIDCAVCLTSFNEKENYQDHKTENFCENVSVGDEVLNWTSKLDRAYGYLDLTIDVKICLKKYRSFPTRVAMSFNDKSSSDFVVLCQDKEFYVHQYILKQQCKYFEGLLQSECIENKQKRIVIEDFEPEVVKILLLYLYNGAICWYDVAKGFEMFESVLKIADKYNLTELLDSIDSQFAQWTQFHVLPREFGEDKTFDEKSILVKHIQRVIKLMDIMPLPKTAMLFFKWRNAFLREKSNKDKIISDDEWAAISLANPDFTRLCFNVAGRKDYQDWAEQHSSWMLHFCSGIDQEVDEDLDPDVNQCCVIIGPLGEIEGAVECSPIWPRKD